VEPVLIDRRTGREIRHGAVVVTPGPGWREHAPENATLNGTGPDDRPKVAAQRFA